MEPTTQKLIHTFGALADLGQEIANTGDFNEMVRTSLHLLLGTLAIRRGAVLDCGETNALQCVARWGPGEQPATDLTISQEETARVLAHEPPIVLVSEAGPA